MPVILYENDLGRCPVCGAKQGAHAIAEEDDNLRLPPQPDDIIVCAYCAEVLKVTPGRTLRSMTRVEKEELPLDTMRNLSRMVAWVLVHMPKERKVN